MKTNLNEVQKLQKIAGIIKENVNDAPRAKKSMPSKLIMDTWAFDEDFMKYLSDSNITFKILQWNGPPRVNAKVEYYGDRAALEAMIDVLFDSGDEEQNQHYKDQIQPA